MTDWQNRIVGEGTKPAREFLANPGNWRIHPKFQQDVMTDVFKQVGWIQRVVENVRNGHLIDGHLRVELALSAGEETPVPYLQVDLSEEEENFVLSTLDPISTLAVADRQQLQDLMSSLSTESDNIKQLFEMMNDGQAGINAGYTPPPSENLGYKQFSVMLTTLQAAIVDKLIERTVEDGHGDFPDNPHKHGNALFYLLMSLPEMKHELTDGS